MKKLFIFGLIIWMFMGCKTARIDPAEELNDTFWTGFFTYDGVKSPVYEPLKQPFGIEFLSDGEFRFYEALGVSGGKWILNKDKTITVTQDNKNMITFQYDAQNQKINFLKMQGSPAPWQALEIEKYTMKAAISTIANITWIDGVGFPVTIKLEPTPRLEGVQNSSRPATVKNNLIWGKWSYGGGEFHWIYMYREKEDVLWGTNVFKDNTGTTYPHRKR